MSFLSQLGWTTRRINGLHPNLRPLAWAVVGRARYELGIWLTITQGTRTDAQQATLYRKGRDAKGKVTDLGKVVTWAKPGQSNHQRRRGGKPGGCAFDIAKLLPNGAVVWKGVPWMRLGRIGEDLGLQWGGRWRGKKKDKPHFQLHRRSRT